MPEPSRLEKAKLIELESDFSDPKSGGKEVPVQINPETLKVSFANQLVQPASGGDRRGTQARQFVGAGTTKLALQLWFDVTGELPEAKRDTTDVRELTREVVYFITPAEESGGGGGGGQGGGSQTAYVPPAVRFTWGTFRFDGLMDSLEESLEFWSGDGKPLRSSLTVALSQQKISNAFNPAGAAGAQSGPAAGAGAVPGTTPLTPAPAGANVQSLAAAQGRGADWQSIATANGIENPRALAPGQLIDMSAGVRAGVRLEAGLG